MSIDVHSTLKPHRLLRRLHRTVERVATETKGFIPISTIPFLVSRNGTLSPQIIDDVGLGPSNCESHPHDLAEELLIIAYHISRGRYTEKEIEILEMWSENLAENIHRLLPYMVADGPPFAVRKQKFH